VICFFPFETALMALPTMTSSDTGAPPRAADELEAACGDDPAAPLIVNFGVGDSGEDFGGGGGGCVIPPGIGSTGGGGNPNSSMSSPSVAPGC